MGFHELSSDMNLLENVRLVLVSSIDSLGGNDITPDMMSEIPSEGSLFFQVMIETPSNQYPPRLGESLADTVNTGDLSTMMVNAVADVEGIKVDSTGHFTFSVSSQRQHRGSYAL